MTSLTLRLDPILQLTDDQFLEICRANPDVKLEQNEKGELIIVAPTGGDTGIYNAKLTTRFVVWNEQAKLGEVFDSSTCFQLPSGAKRSPDVAWVHQDRWDSLSPEEKEKFPPIAPDFVLELLSPTDSLKELQEKMQEYISNGVKLGWLLDRKTRRVEIYRPGQDVEILEDSATLSGENLLPNFRLNLQSVW